jgi:hypothetical protein
MLQPMDTAMSSKRRPDIECDVIHRRQAEDWSIDLRSVLAQLQVSILRYWLASESQFQEDASVGATPRQRKD